MHRQPLEIGQKLSTTLAPVSASLHWNTTFFNSISSKYSTFSIQNHVFAFIFLKFRYFTIIDCEFGKSWVIRLSCPTKSWVIRGGKLKIVDLLEFSDGGKLKSFNTVEFSAVYLSYPTSMFELSAIHFEFSATPFEFSANSVWVFRQPFWVFRNLFWVSFELFAIKVWGERGNSHPRERILCEIVTEISDKI